MLRTYLKAVVAFTVTVLAFVCIACVGAAAWFYILAEQSPPIVERLTYVGSLFGLAAFLLAALAYYIHLDIHERESQ